MKKVLTAVLLLLALLWLANNSLMMPRDEAKPRFVAHRGVHQTFSLDGLTGDSCTAAHIEPPRHGLIENTLPSMKAAFDAGAEVVEIDIHRTTDGHFAVFHDWTLDCRTEGEGETRRATMAELKALDAGYGYTADGGQNYPLRGSGIGLIPELSEVFAAFPEGRFLVNFKSGRASDGAAFAAFLTARPEWQDRLFAVYGGHAPSAEAAARLPGLKYYSRKSTGDCLIAYALVGWSGHVPGTCRKTVVAVPSSHAKFLWGWPHRFTVRMEAAGSEVILLGPHRRGDPGSSGIDDAAALSRVPDGFSGLVWTNRIETLGTGAGDGAIAREKENGDDGDGSPDSTN